MDSQGFPVGMEVYPGNTSDPNTLADQAHKLKEVTLVADRGLLTQARIDALQAFPGISHLSALRSTEIHGLVEDGDLQMSLFDTQNLCEIAAPEFPGGAPHRLLQPPSGVRAKTEAPGTPRSHR